eukprot:TRINITY_DN46600_c0_g1_i1.p1 TRINITY_DN46600_c0_g1~~TRINITY_DN46600_c0_g1_i1.p1  ORF type:complete len:1026 (+),score=160.36 TRINITY_DN46600_c0_g1_i1:277-3078(+)
METAAPKRQRQLTKRQRDEVRQVLDSERNLKKAFSMIEGVTQVRKTLVTRFLALAATSADPADHARCLELFGAVPVEEAAKGQPKTQQTPRVGVKKIVKQLRQKLASGDLEDALALAESIDSKALTTELIQLLFETVARMADASIYARCLKVMISAEAQINIKTFVNALGYLTARLPVPAAMVRLTLNMAIPVNGQTVPLVPEMRLSGKKDVLELERSLFLGCSPASKWLEFGTMSVEAAKKAKEIEALFETTLDAEDDDSKKQAENYDAERLALEEVSPESLLGLVDIPHAAASEYFGHFSSVHHLDFIEELQAVERTIQNTPPEKLERRDLMLRGLQRRPGFEKNMMSLLSKSNRIFGSDDLKSMFLPGQHVWLSRSNPLQEPGETTLVSIVSTVASPEGNGTTITVALPRGQDVKQSDLTGQWRLDCAANYQAYTRQMKAVGDVATQKEDRQRPLWRFLTEGKVGGDNVDKWVAQLQAGDVHSSMPPEEEATKLSRIRSWADEQPERISSAALAEAELDPGLNESQREAVLSAAGRRLSLIQGPPGTGKTHVSVQLLLLFKRMRVGRPCLVVSHNNIAVDNIAASALRQGLKVVRVGRSEMMSSEMEECALYAMVPRTEHRASDDEAIQDVLRKADVVCVTNIGSGVGALSRTNYQAILMDEAAQATELSSIVPIMNCSAAQLILVGDQCQLPANAQSFEAEVRGLTLSLFSRLLGQGLPHAFLDTQFRMHPAIARHSASTFYENRLKDGVTPVARKAPAGFPWPCKDVGVAFISPSHAPETRSDAGASWSNPGEAQIVMEILRGVLSAGDLSANEIGVVTPYMGQVRTLRQHVRQELASDMLEDPRELEIKSVDGFQGREKELIIFSAVRSNSWGNVGFLADWRRLNVMVTRARRGLIVVGDVRTLSKDPSWASWIEYAQQEGFQATKL